MKPKRYTIKQSINKEGRKITSKPVPQNIPEEISENTITDIHQL